jgi:two-component system sensor histidine kinase UhpB
MFKLNNKYAQIFISRWRYIVAAVVPTLLISVMLGYLLLNVISEIKVVESAMSGVSNMAGLHQVTIDLQKIRGRGQFLHSANSSALHIEKLGKLHKAIAEIQLQRGMDKPVPVIDNNHETIMRLRGNVLTSIDSLIEGARNIDKHAIKEMLFIKQEILHLFSEDYINNTSFKRFEEYTKTISHMHVEILAESRYVYSLLRNNKKNIMYIMELFELDIPNLIESVGRVRGYGSTLLAGKNITRDKLRKWIELTGGGRESLERVETKLKVYEKTVNEQNFSTSVNIKSALEQINNFIKYTSTLAGKEQVTDSEQLYFESGTLAIEHCLLIYDAIKKSIKTSLIFQQRELKVKFAVLLLGSAVVVLLLLYFTAAFYRDSRDAFYKIAKANDELFRNSMRLKKIVDLLPLMVVVRDAMGKILLENRAYKEAVSDGDMNSYQSNNITGKLFFDDDKILSGEKSITKKEYEFIDRHGNKHVMQLSKIFYEPGNDGVNAVLTVALDITDSKRIQSLQNVAGVGYWEWHTDTNKFYASDEFCSIIGWDKSDFDGDINFLLQAIVDEDRQQLIDILEQQDDSSVGYNAELRIKLENKKPRYVRIQCHRYQQVSDGGQIMVGTIQDITFEVEATRSLRNSEEKYRLLVESLREEYFFYNRDISGRITYVSSSIHNVLGYSTDEFLKHTCASESMSGRIYNENSLDCVSSDNEKPYEIVMTDTLGGEHFIELSEVLIFDDAGKVSIVEGIAHDTTKRKKTENNLRLSEKKLHELAVHLQNAREEERINISRDIHDEVGGMLAALKMDINLIFTRLKQADVDRTIHDRLEKTSLHIDMLIQTVRRIISNLRPSVLDNLGLLEAIEWQLSEFRNHYGIEYHYDCLLDDKQLKFNNEGDAVMNIFRVVQEITTNIIRHSDASLVTVLVTIVDNDFVLSISDNGCGIDDEQLSKTNSFGIIGMQERVRSLKGVFTLISRKDVAASLKNDVGTTIIVSVPLYVLEN